MAPGQRRGFLLTVCISPVDILKLLISFFSMVNLECSCPCHVVLVEYCGPDFCLMGFDGVLILVTHAEKGGWMRDELEL